MKLSVVIPAYNEAESIPETLLTLYQELNNQKIEHEILVVNDNSKDTTLTVLQELTQKIPSLVIHTNKGPNGFGYAVRYGLERFSGDCVAVMMADLSDSPQDLVAFYNKMLEGYDCVFGSRWMKGGAVYDYPLLKKRINRLANFIVKIVFRIKYNDCTNAFKLYKRNKIMNTKDLSNYS